ncbi:MAG: hypothetical protein GX413_06485 [Acetobacter sp.]|nr:hypothetical protein [Acetobacter sp.]
MPSIWLRRGVIIAACMFIGFSTIIIDGWILILYPPFNKTTPMMLLSYTPPVVGLLILLVGFYLLGRPIPNDPSVPLDDVENMDGA